MKKRLVIGLIVLVVIILGFTVKSMFFSSEIKAEVQEEIRKDDIEEIKSKKEEETESKENVSIGSKNDTGKNEKTIEQKEREIESTKPQSKITIRPLKDASSGKEYYELEDDALHFAIDGVSFKPKDSITKVKITERLTNEDIERIQSYGYNWHTGYANEVPPNSKYGEYYGKYPKDTETVIEKYIPQRLGIYNGALVGWITDPNLVYETFRGYYGISGVLQLSYLREDNVFGLEPEKGYERDVEFRYANTTNGLFLTQVIYLSDWRELESWENPYK